MFMMSPYGPQKAKIKKVLKKWFPGGPETHGIKVIVFWSEGS